MRNYLKSKGIINVDSLLSRYSYFIYLLLWFWLFYLWINFRFLFIKHYNNIHWTINNTTIHYLMNHLMPKVFSTTHDSTLYSYFYTHSVCIYILTYRWKNSLDHRSQCPEFSMRYKFLSQGDKRSSTSRLPSHITYLSGEQRSQWAIKFH